MTEVLAVAGLSKSYVTRSRAGRPETVRAAQDVDLVVRAGETLALVGESGCGKTTVGRCMARLIDPTSGTITFEGRDLTGLGDRGLRPLRRRLQYVFQDPYASLNPRLTVLDALLEPARAQGRFRRAEAEPKARALADRVGITAEQLHRYPHEFSGGQRQRVVIARALMLDPILLVLDEPVSALDVSVQAQVINLLSELQRELGLAYVFISHDLSVVAHAADRVAVMYLGRVVEQGDRADIFDHARHPYTQALLSAVPIAEPRERAASPRIPLTGDLPSPARLPSGCSFRTRCRHVYEPCAVDRPELITVAAGHAAACHLVSEKES